MWIYARRVCLLACRNRRWACRTHVEYELVGARWMKGAPQKKKSLKIMTYYSLICVERYHKCTRACLKRDYYLLKQRTNAGCSEGAFSGSFLVLDHVHVYNDGLKGTGPRTAQGSIPWQLDATCCALLICSRSHSVEFMLHCLVSRGYTCVDR